MDENDQSRGTSPSKSEPAGHSNKWLMVKPNNSTVSLLFTQCCFRPCVFCRLLNLLLFTDPKKENVVFSFFFFFLTKKH